MQQVLVDPFYIFDFWYFGCELSKLIDSHEKTTILQ